VRLHPKCHLNCISLAVESMWKWRGGLLWYVLRVTFCWMLHVVLHSFLYSSLGIFHLSIAFFSLLHESARSSSASIDWHDITCIQSSYGLLHKQHSFVPPYHCVCLGPVNARLCTSFAIAICLAFDIHFSATFCRFQYMLSNVPSFHCSFSIRYSLKSPSSNCCVKRSFQSLVIFVPLMKRAHLSPRYNPQFGLAPCLPVAVSLIISHN
jgi:hypothetical protein